MEKHLLKMQQFFYDRYGIISKFTGGSIRQPTIWVERTQRQCLCVFTFLFKHYFWKDYIKK